MPISDERVGEKLLRKSGKLTTTEELKKYAEGVKRKVDREKAEDILTQSGKASTDQERRAIARQGSVQGAAEAVELARRSGRASTDQERNAVRKDVAKETKEVIGRLGDSMFAKIGRAYNGQ